MRSNYGTLKYVDFSTPLGHMLAATKESGLLALRFCEPDRIAHELRDLAGRHPGYTFAPDPAGLPGLVSQLRDVLAGRVPASVVALDPDGTPFQKKVWQVLAAVPWGQTLCYTQLAERAGRPGAIRAVASACASNPIVFVIPCHRILRKDGSLGGYYYGLDRKQMLLEREQTI